MGPHAVWIDSSQLRGHPVHRVLQELASCAECSQRASFKHQACSQSSAFAQHPSTDLQQLQQTCTSVCGAVVLPVATV